jgi:signal transduction histidine kinase
MPPCTWKATLNARLPPPLPVGITYAPLLSEENKLRNVIVSVRDITHFRTADEIKATFISIVSHELRTPVALIKGIRIHTAARRCQMGQAHHQRFARRHRRGSRPPLQYDR